MQLSAWLIAYKEEFRMEVKGRKLIAVLIGLFMLATMGAPWAGSQPEGEADGDRGPLNP